MRIMKMMPMMNMVYKGIRVTLFDYYEDYYDDYYNNYYGNYYKNYYNNYYVVLKF